MFTTFTLAALIVVGAVNLLLALGMLFVGRSLVPGGV